MGSIQIEVNDEKREYTPAPEGLHQAVCVDVVDLGIVTSNFGGEEKSRPMLRIVWQIEQRMENGKRFSVGQRYTQSLHEKASLRKAIAQWEGKKDLPPEQWQHIGRNLEEYLIGKPAQVMVVHDTRIVEGKERTYANISAIMPYMGSDAMQPEDYIRMQDRDGYEPPEAATPRPAPSNGNGGAVRPDAAPEATNQTWQRDWDAKAKELAAGYNEDEPDDSIFDGEPEGTATLLDDAPAVAAAARKGKGKAADEPYRK